MAVTIDNILESISNPQGKFRTLQGIYPVSGQDGIPFHTFRDPYLKFLVIWDGKSHTLTIPFGGTSAGASVQMKNVSRLTSNIRSRHLVLHSYLETELTVFDDNGEPHSMDVILAGNPQGRSLLDYAKEKAFAGDNEAVKKSFEAFLETARWLLGSGLTHGRIHNASLRIDDNHNIKLLDYRYLTDEPSNGDTKNIAAVALYLKALVDDQQFIFRVGHIPPGIIAERLLENIPAKTLSDRQELIAALDSMSGTPATAVLREVPEAHNSGYDHIEPAREGIRRVERGGLFGFIDRDEKEIAPPVFQFATDFAGGRSAVVLDDHFGLLCADGKYILEPVYESIDWYPEEGIAIASYEGLFGIIGRNGETIVPFSYDWMGTASEGTVCVKRDGLYGYLNIAGDAVVEPVYTDAGSFHCGQAPVKLGGTSFHINKRGEKI